MVQKAERTFNTDSERQAAELARAQRGEDADHVAVCRRNRSSAHTFECGEVHRKIAVALFLLAKEVAAAQQPATRGGRQPPTRESRDRDRD